MSWVALRQQRLLLLLLTTLVVAIAAVLVFYRINALSFLDENGIHRCMLSGGEGCPTEAVSAFDDAYGGFVSTIPFALLAVPLLVGMFAGAPLFAREFEQDTHIFALTQSISRTRWWATKVALSAVPALLLTLALGALSAWAMQPFTAISPSRLRVPGFETEGTVIGAYTLLAFALGATTGLLVRNTLGAMAITIAGYLAVIVTLANTARPHYLGTRYLQSSVDDLRNGMTSIGPSGVPAGSWQVRSGFLGSDGNPINVPDACFGTPGLSGCLKRNGVTSTFAEYHPPSQFWSMQLAESGIVLVLAVALIGLGAWVLRKWPY